MLILKTLMLVFKVVLEGRPKQTVKKNIQMLEDGVGQKL